MKIEIRFFGGSRSGQQEVLDAKPCIRIGRRADNDVVFDPYKDLDVSGHHAELRQEPDGFYLYDLGSSNGTFVGGAKISRLRLASGQEVSFGLTGPKMVLAFQDPAQAAAASYPAAAPQAQAAQVPVHPPPQHSAPQAAPQAPAQYPPAQHPPAQHPPAQHPPPVGPAAALGQGGQVGQRTVAMMINSAMQQSRDAGKSGKGSPTVFMRAMVNQAVKKSTRKFKVITAFLLLLLIGAVGFLFAYPYIFPESPTNTTKAQKQLLAKHKALQQKVDELKEMTGLLKQHKNASDKDKEKFLKKIEQLNQKVAGAKGGNSGKAIAARTTKGIFVIAVNSTSGARGYCTAFAVHKRVAATNAHCIKALERYLQKGGKSFLVMNQNPSKRFNIIQHVAHPGYHKPVRSISPDVGLIKVDRDLEVQLDIAGGGELRQLGAGDIMYTYGFPGRLADVSSPAATFGQGIVGRVTKLDGRIGSFERSHLVQHSAFTSGGTSGSPIFNTDGKVIAINAGGYREPGSEVVKDILTGRARMMMVGKTLTGYNFAIRIDVLGGLLDDFGE